MPLDLQLAQRCLELSGAAYEDPDKAQLLTEQLGLTGFQYFEGRSTQAFIAINHTQVYLAFRGTEADPVDWLADARFKPKQGVWDTDVHSGFSDALDEVWWEITGALSKIHKPLVTTGHSLGGALAVLAAARHREQERAIKNVITFGQPRTGTRAFADQYNHLLGAITHRVINHVDVVTRVPLMLQGYRHVGRRVYAGPNKQLVRDASAWRIAIDDVRYRLTHFGSIKSAGLTPHYLAGYRDIISGL